MDPNECLAELRKLAQKHETGMADEQGIDDLVEHFRALDEWLMRGGFAPEDWAAPRGLVP